MCFVFSGTFTVDQAVDALGFGKFQIKLSIITGLAWVSVPFILVWCIAGWRSSVRHGMNTLGHISKEAN